MSAGKPNPGDRWWCSDVPSCGFVDKDHRCQQWATVHYIPIECINKIKEAPKGKK